MDRIPRLAAAAGLPFLYLLGCATLAAALAYPLFLATGGNSISGLRTLVSRGGQVFLVLGLYPLWRWLAPPPGSFGIGPGFRRQLAVGFGLGVLILGFHLLLLLALDLRALRPDWGADAGRLAGILGKALLTGLAVALLEETIFRGALFGLVRVRAGALAAVLISAFYYAGLHFLGSRWEGDLAAVGPETGFRIALDAFANLGHMDPGSFLGLFLAGALLGVVRARIPQGLGYCYGLHAGWVAVIKTAKPLTVTLADSPHSFLVGQYDHFVGYLSAAWIGLLIAAGLAWLRPGTREAGP
jgi:membrane protease YdiL (CAAX protease family)